MDRNTQTIAGFAFLALMVIFVVLAITTFNGTPTTLLIVGAILFLAVGLFMLAGPSSGGDSDGQSQQQSVTLSDGQVLTQQSGSVLNVCRSCRTRLQPGFAYCPGCGASA